MDPYQKQIIDFLKKQTGLDQIELSVPPNQEMGDYAFPCFQLAKQLKKNPVEIAKQLSNNFSKNKKGYKKISEIKALGPYLNFFIKKDDLIKKTISEILKQKDKYGSSGIGKGKKILVEHTSINPNASAHVGRARNALIGDSVVRILKFQGYKVETHYFVNDVGKQIALLVLGARKKRSLKFEDLLKIYIDINKKLEKDPSLEKQALHLLNLLEKRDPKVKKQFKNIVDTCVKGQAKIFSDLDIHYDYFDYESEYLWSKKTEKSIRLLEKTGKLFLDGYNRWVLDQKGYGLGMKIPVFVLTRGDGTSLYSLRDIAYTIEKVSKGENIIVLGEDQKLYFEQMSAVLKELMLKPPRVVHYSFVLLQEGKMSTRKGNLVLLEDFMKEASKKALDEIKKRHDITDKIAAKAIGYGALKYGMLRVSPEKSVTFNWESALSFEGDASPYIQYAYARINSILQKHKVRKKDSNFKLLNNEEETTLIKILSDFPNIVEKATKELKPHIIANYSYTLAQKFNEYYHKHPILKADDNLKHARIELIKTVAQVIKNSLSLLGITVLEKM